jgi:hypothetical protein
MTKQRTVGARSMARLTACTFLAMSPLAQADDAPPPFAEYRAAGQYYRDPAEASMRAMWQDCDNNGYLQCQLLVVRTTDSGYDYIYQYLHDRPGGDAEWMRFEDGGPGVYSCPVGFSLYQIAFGMPLGPYANRSIDLGGPFPVYCQADGHPSARAPRMAIVDTFDKGELTVREVTEGERTVRWTVTPDTDGRRVQAMSTFGTSSFLVSDDRVVVVDDAVTLVYAADGTLEAARGADGTSIDRQGRYDPEGRLDSLLRRAILTLPASSSTGALGAVNRASESIRALLDNPAP